MAATANADYESKAILLHALSRGRAGRFRPGQPAVSRPAVALHRGPGPPGPGLRRDGPQADGRRTARRCWPSGTSTTPATRRESAKGSLPWSHSPAELRALYALALQEVTPKSPKAKELVDWLLAHRTGHRWSPDKATGPAALALCRWFAESRFEGERYKLTVFVNDVQAKVLDIDPAAGTQIDRRAGRAC